MVEGRRFDLLHGLAVILTLGIAAALVVRDTGIESTKVAPAQASRAAAQVETVELADGRRAVVDATRHPVPVGDYRRIIAASTAARGLLLELVEAQRVVAVSDYGLDQSPERHRFASITRIQDIGKLEQTLSLKADLVLLHGMREVDKIARLREAGLEVFDLGDQRGLDMFLEDVAQVAVLLGREARGHQYAEAFRQRLQGVAVDIPEGARKRGIYLSIYGPRIFGGTVGSSYHDILTYGGLIDAAAEDYHEWPQYSVEQLLALDPEIMITSRGSRALLCRQAGLDTLKVCRGRGRVIELEGALLSDPGPGMLHSAELIRNAVYGPRTAEPAHRRAVRVEGAGR